MLGVRSYFMCETKVCKKCGLEKPLIAFVSDKYNADGKRNTCKECRNKSLRNESISIERRLHRNAKKRTQCDNNKEKELFYGARERARKYNLLFDLSPEDIVIPEICPALGIPIIKNLRGRGPQDASPTLDRIDSNKGYVKGNICVISYRANMIKNYGDAEEHRKVADYIDKNKH
jgi:hypothetical protein